MTITDALRRDRAVHAAEDVAALLLAVEREARRGYCAAQFVGYVDRTDPVWLVEIYETGSEPLTYHYWTYYLPNGTSGEVYTVGAVAFSPDDKEPPAIVRRQFGGLTWRRLR